MTHTHRMITSPMLRRAFARELLSYRKARKYFSPADDSMLRFGMESGIWAIQKELAFHDNNDK